MARLRNSARNLVKVAGIIVLPLVVFGCQGSSTYGTGKTSGEHLVDGLGGLLGSREKKAPINYSPRPGLVAPPKGEALPAPSDNDAVADAGLPEDPEIRRARLRANAPKADERSGELPIEVMKRKRAPGGRRVPIAKWDRDGTFEDYKPRAHRREFLKRKAELAGVRGAAPRRYLTEPPQKYRTPVSTAPIGEIGEDESTKAHRRKFKKKSWWNPFG